MAKKYRFQVTNGVDSAVRVIATLRRKQYAIKEFSMEELEDKSTLLYITLENDLAFLDKAVCHMEKLVDVYDVKEVQVCR
ncbi:hypothetical protein [Chakrabartyella piscis]|uniref:hypothetical protein n=1 Tax=Chakrabartyella piscis TaxID=2918914 RepID=UPI002958AB17|nr:hypothetical protein [Chakrabartyella piscis]